MMTCPLCQTPDIAAFGEADGNPYFRCPWCALIFMHSSARPSAQQERAHYELHENTPSDPGYRQFLSRLSTPLLEKLPTRASGLDYGCGTGPALVAMMQEAGHLCDGYDPLFANHGSALNQRYDFVTCTEVVEHFHEPRKEFDQLVRLLRPGGWLAVMTSWYPPEDQFLEWHYRRDPTHVCFYSPRTFQWLSQHYDLELEMPAQNISLLRAPD